MADGASELRLLPDWWRTSSDDEVWAEYVDGGREWPWAGDPGEYARLGGRELSGEEESEKRLFGCEFTCSEASLRGMDILGGASWLTLEYLLDSDGGGLLRSASLKDSEEDDGTRRLLLAVLEGVPPPALDCSLRALAANTCSA